MDPQKITWKKQIAENQQFRSTWLVEVEGEKYIAKKIETENTEKLQSLIKTLRRQIHFNAILNEDEQKKISLFEDTAEGNGYVAFLRKFRDGTTLAECLASKRYQIADAVSLMIKICRAVQVAHEHNVYHGDLKPANIIVSDSGEVTIIDWDTMSISASVKSELIGSEVTVEQVSGTPHYMPAEQFKGEKISQQNDVYALGVILYQILSGETPFDSICGQTSSQMAIYKQNHEPESILVKHAALGVPADLGKLIDESLKNDKNKRIQSLSTFIQRLETIGKITPPSGGGIPPTAGIPPTIPAHKKYVPAKEKGKEHKLVLIGHTGSGKTVLAAGLYSIDDTDFAVDDPGSNTETGIHAINTKTILQEGQWPAATSIGEITKLKFKLNYKGKEEAISFDEYAGERLEMENFDNAIVKDPDGAFILLNPGGAQWHKALSRNKLLSDMKHYIDLLSKKLNHPPVAMVITASDRLKSDLKDFEDEFKGYVTQLENHLKRKKCTYKVFYVSVSGVLENQERPHLNPQGIKDPFIWLLNCFTSRAIKKHIKKGIAIAALVAVALGLIWCANWGRESYKVHTFHKDFLALQKSFNEQGTKSDDDLISYRQKLLDLRNSVCEQKHIALTKRQGDCSSVCMPKFFLSSYQEKFLKDLSSLEDEIDTVNNDYFARSLERALATANEENRKVVEWIRNWQPLLQTGIQKKAIIQKKCDQEMPLAIERFDTNFLKEEFLKVISTPSIQYPLALESKYEQWLKTKTVLSAEERQVNEKKLKQLEHEARVAVENKHYDTLLAELEQITQKLPQDIQQKLSAWEKHDTVLPDAEREEKNKKIRSAYLAAAQRVFEYNVDLQKNKIASFNGTVVDLGVLVKNFFKFKEIPVYDIQEDVVSQKYEDLQKSLVRVVEEFIQRENTKAQKKLMASDSYFKPSYAQVVKEHVTSLFPSETQNVLNSQINALVETGKNEWYQAQEQKVDEFIAKIQYRNASDALDQFRSFCYDNKRNPYMKKAEEKLLKIVFDEVKDILTKFDHSESSYLSLKKLSAKIRTTNCEMIQKTSLYRFANSFFNMMEISHTLYITDIEVCSSYSRGAYIDSCWYWVGQQSRHTMFYDLSWDEEDAATFKSWRKMPHFSSITIACHPWEKFSMKVDLWENVSGPDNDLVDWTVSITPGKKGKSNYAEYDLEGVTMRIYYSTNYKNISELLEEAK